MRMLMTIGLATAFAAALQTAPAAAQTPESYGTGSLTVQTIPATSFGPRNSAVTITVPGGGLDMYASGTVVASPLLPNGSQIERVELRACDTDPVEAVQFRLWSCPTPNASCVLAGFVQTIGPGAPGCVDVFSDLGSPFIVDNQVPMWCDVRTTSHTSSTTFTAVKIYYRLRVSPSPAVATFPNDVPTGHPYFRFVEALAAAGITSGCGPGAYCPDVAITRGQMAVFLAAALGLHFPN